MSTFDDLNAAGAENCHPSFIGEVNGKKEVLARDIDGTIYLTDAGKEFLAQRLGADKPKAARTSKREAKQVQSANELADDSDLLDLSE